jgi:O-antigen/teichoic acid export membrane protein
MKIVFRWFLYSTPVFVALLLILAQWIGWGYAAAIVLVLALTIDIPVALSARKRRDGS